MSFGGGREQYTLEYIVKVVNQGGGGALNQINQGFTKTSTTATQATVSTEKLAAASNRLSQAQMGMTKSLKSTAFGFFGITTAGAEMMGMLSMLQQVQLAQKEATEEQAQALKEGGKESKAYKDATQELVKVNRWASMTTRNFMLSIFDMIPFTIMAVHGLTKMATAAKELKAARAAAENLRLLGFNAKGVAAQMLTAGTSIGGFTPQISKFSKATTIATTGTFKFGQETVKTTKFFGAGEAALISNAVAMGKAEKAATGASKAMRVLGIAMKVAIPLIALEIGSQAYERNWGGFRDRINEVGVAIGKAIPQMQGFLGTIKKVGESVVAVFTGNWERIGSIWDDTANGVANSTKEMSEKQRKAMEELAEKVLDLNSAVFDTLSEAAGGDRGEQRDFLKSMGLDKDARNDMRKVLDDIEEIDQAVLGLHNALDTMRTLNLMKKFGLDVPSGMWKEVAKGLSNIFEDLGDRFPGDDMFDQFAEVMEDASKKKGPAVLKAIMAFMDDNPNFLPFLTAHSPEIAAEITTMLNEAGYKVDASGLVTGVNDAVKNAFSSGDIINPKGGENKGFVPGSAFAKASGQSNAGPLSPIVDKIKTGLAALKTEIEGLDWNSIGTSLNTGIKKIFAAVDVNAIGQWIRIHVASPIFVEIGNQFRPLIEEFKNNPIGAIGMALDISTKWISEFVAGLFGYNSEEEMFETWEKQLTDFFADQPVLQGLKMLINDPIGSIIAIIQGKSFWGSSDESVDISEHTLGPNVKKALGINSKGAAGDFLDQLWKDLGIQEFLDSIPTAEEIRKKIMATPGVQEIIDFVNAVKSGAGGFLDWLWSIGKQDAEGATAGFDPNSPANFGNLGTIEVTVPNIIVNGGTFTSGPIPETINPPAGMNATPPSFDVPNAFIRPQSLIPDISGSTITSVTANGGKESGGMPGVWDEAYALYIDYAGTAIVKPQSVAYDLSGSQLTSISTGGDGGEGTDFVQLLVDAGTIFKKIGELWDTDVVAKIADGSAALASHWSDKMNSFGANAESGAEQSESALLDAFSNIESKMTDLAKHWSKMCNSMIKNAKSAASGITKAMNSIPDTESVHTIRVRRVYEFAEGGEMSGVISAAGGKILTTHGEQMFKIGDNPGGQESIWAIPHNRPGPIVEQINDMYGSSTGIARSGVISSQPIEIHTHNHYLERDVETIKRIENNRLVSRFGG